jgi:hypothetical protein
MKGSRAPPGAASRCCCFALHRFSHDNLLDGISAGAIQIHDDEVRNRRQPTTPESSVGLVGDDHYFATSDPDTFEHLAGPLDVIINPVSARIDVDAYLALLASDGTLVNAAPQPNHRA